MAIRLRLLWSIVKLNTAIKEYQHWGVLLGLATLVVGLWELEQGRKLREATLFEMVSGRLEADRNADAPGPTLELSSADVTMQKLADQLVADGDLENAAILQRALERAVQDLPDGNTSKPILERMAGLGITMSGLRADRVNLMGIDLAAARLQGSRFEESVLAYADLSGANMSSIGDSTFGRTNLNEAWLYEADLSGAVLDGASLRGAKLSNANLRKASFLASCAREADFSYSDLTGADLSFTDLSGSYLRTADGLTQDQLDSACGKDVDLPEGLSIAECKASFCDVIPSVNTFNLYAKAYRTVQRARALIRVKENRDLTAPD